MTTSSRSTAPLAAGTSDQRAQRGTGHGAHRPCGRALTFPSESLHFLESEWSAEEWAALKRQNSKQRRRSKREISHAAHLKRVEFLATQWSADILVYYGWSEKSRDFILKLSQCAKKYPRYEDDFVPQANLVLWLKHCAAISAINAPATNEKSFAGSFKAKDLDYLIELDETNSTDVYGIAVTRGTARERQEDIKEWTQSQDSLVHLHGKMIDLRTLRADHWNTYLLRFDRTGLLTRRGELESLKVTNGNTDQSPVPAAVNLDGGFLHDSGDNENFIIRDCGSTDVEAPTAIRINDTDRNALRPSGSSTRTPSAEEPETTYSSMRSPARPPKPPTLSIGDVIVLSDDECLEERAAAREVTDQTGTRSGILAADDHNILYEEATMVEQIPHPIVQVAYRGGLSRELVPPLDNDYARRQRSAATKGIGGTDTSILATVGELPRNPISPQTQQENMQKTSLTAVSPKHAASPSHELAEKHVATDDATDGTVVEQLRLGNIVGRLRKWKEQYERKQQEIECMRNALPDIHALKDSAAEAVERATELTRLAEEARQAADSVLKAYEVAQYQADTIAAAEQSSVKLLQNARRAREELGID